MKLSFEELGGRAILDKVSKVFYDKIYAHSWIGQYFKDVPQKLIEEQQADFMQHALGGPNKYLGALPIPAHQHMMITDELFDLRESLLLEAFKEAEACEELVRRWTNIDEAFRNKLVKKTASECKPRFTTDPILDFEKPFKKAA